MKKLLCLLGGAMLAFHVQSQEIKPLSIGDTVPDILFDSVMNFPKSEFKLSDFKGKLVILDFFGTWCGACMPYIPKLDSFQKELKDKIQVIVICDDPSNEVVSKFIKKKWKDKGIDIKLPFVLVDSLKSGLFPHRMVPHEIWITPEGKLMATTEGKEVSLANLNAALLDPTIKLKQKVDQMDFDREKPLFVNGNGGSMKILIVKSILSKKIDGIGSMAGSKIDSTNHVKRIYFTNLSPVSFFQNAFKYPRSKIMLQGKDSLHYVNDLSGNWIKDDMYCYELTMPDTTSRKQINRYMLDDIEQGLKIHAELEQKLLDVYVLEEKKSNISLQKRAKKLQSYIPLNKNSTLSLISNIETLGYTPAIDITTESTRSRMRIPLRDIKDDEQLKLVLQANDLELKRVKRRIEVVVIYDNSVK